MAYDREAIHTRSSAYAITGGQPNFIGDSDTIAAITISGDTACRATNVDLRLDTQSAQDFLAQFGVPRG